jgi:hypothetical protein
LSDSGFEKLPLAIGVSNVVANLFAQGINSVSLFRCIEVGGSSFLNVGVKQGERVARKGRICAEIPELFLENATSSFLKPKAGPTDQKIRRQAAG